MQINYAQEFVKELYNAPKIPNEEQLFKLKNEFSSKHSIPNLKNIELIEAYRELQENSQIKKNSQIERLISRRKIRSESGVSVITCLTKPFSCPGKCTYCPTEPNMPKSYLSNQPAAMRAVLNKFDAFNQVQNRLASLMVTGHNPSKVEIIIIGGTWSFLPKNYQEDFIKDIYNGLNQKIENKDIEKNGQFFKVPKIEKRENLSLEEALKKNEIAKQRCVGLTLETRPDFITEEELKRFRNYGCTRVEIGVQSLDDEVQEKTQRGHDVKTVERATKMLRDAGFKIAYHLMPGLPGSNKEKDMKSVRMTFENENFKPDLIKFYPCMVVHHSQLAKEYEEGKFKPLEDEDLKPLLLEMKRLVPRYTRISRLVRDIPSESIIAGCKTINLRQLILQDMEKQNIQCQCIRCREIKTEIPNLEEISMNRLNYKANEGDEVFLSFDTKESDKLISLLRLRIPSQHFSKQEHFIKELEGSAIIREVHTYGIHTHIGAKSENSQHLGFGRKLILEAERIAKEEYGIEKMAVIAGTGVRKYYEKFGYTLEGTYMVKSF